MKLDDFFPIATEAQQEVLISLIDLSNQEEQLEEQINKTQKPYERSAGQMSELVHGHIAGASRQDYHEQAMFATVNDRQALKQVKANLKTILQTAVELGMGHLGIIQRNYESYVGKPIPDQ